MQDVFEAPGIKLSGRKLWTEAANVMRFSFSTLPIVEPSSIVISDFWRNDLKIFEIFSDSRACISSERIMGVLSSMPVPGGVRWKNGELVSNSLGICGSTVPMTDLPILFLVSDIMLSAVLDVGAVDMATVGDLMGRVEKNAVVDETTREAIMMVLKENILIREWWCLGGERAKVV